MSYYRDCFHNFFRNQTGFGRQEQGRNYKYSKNAWESIGTEVINSKHLQTNRDYSLVGSLDAISDDDVDDEDDDDGDDDDGDNDLLSAD